LVLKERFLIILPEFHQLVISLESRILKPFFHRGITYFLPLLEPIFEPADNETAESIRDEIHYRLGMYDNRAKVTDIEVFFLSSGKGFGVNIHAEYQGEKASLSALIDESVYFNFLRAS